MTERLHITFFRRGNLSTKAIVGAAAAFPNS
jgi:hypothetical protein